MFDKKEYMKKYNNKYYLKNKKELQNQKKHYYREHREELLLTLKENYPKRATKCRVYAKKYYQQHLTKMREQAKIRYIDNKDYYKKYQQTDKYKEYHRCYKIKNKIVENLRNRIWKALKNITKSDSTMNLLGCSIKQLKQHLQIQFKKGMTWDNYGFYGWHIDHIIPCLKFNLSKSEEQIKCFHYTNLQPLWASENFKKDKH